MAGNVHTPAAGHRPTLLMTLGLPASGKSTWAREYKDEHPGSVVVTKDELRLLPQAPREFKARERWVVTQRNRIVQEALASGVDVVVADTNLNPVHADKLLRLAEEAGAQFEVIDFTEVEIDECIRRDESRAESVGASVIKNMRKQYPHLW